jgi:hypothetical protein
VPITTQTATLSSQSEVESHLKSQLNSQEILGDASKLLGFLSAIHNAYETKWDEDSNWEEPLLTTGISLGGVSFATLGNPTSPKIFLQAFTKLLSDNWEKIARNEQFQKAGTNFETARSFLTLVQYSPNAHDVANNLNALLLTLNPTSDEKEQAKGEFPYSLSNQLLQTLRPEATTNEKEWTKLALTELRTKLDAKFSALTTRKNAGNAPWTEQDESILKELTALREQHTAWLEKWTSARKKLVQDRLKNFSFTGIDKIDKDLFLKVFVEHTPDTYSPQDDGIVATAAKTYWDDLVTRDLPTGDPGFYFRSSVLDAYDAFIKALKQLITEHAPQVAPLQAQIAKALDLKVSEDEKVQADDGGGASTADETDQSDTARGEAETRSQQQTRWAKLLQRLAALGQNLEGIPDSATSGNVSGSLRRFAQNSLGISGKLDTIEEIVLTLNVPLDAWVGERSADTVQTILDELEQLLQANEELLTQTQSSQDTPGEAARKAQEAAAAAAATQATTAAEQNVLAELDQLKDLSKLHHSHAALTAMALAQLEAELKKRGYSEQEILTFLKENQPALAQYLWAQYLGQLQGTATTPLSSAEVFRLAVSSSLFFVDKFELEKGVRTAPLGPDSLRRAQTGELSPEMRARLLVIAQQHGYDTPEELFAALFGNGDRAVSMAEFIRRAEYAASLNPAKIDTFSRALVQQYLGNKGSDDLLERLMASLERDQYTLEQFFNLQPASLSKEQKQAWEELGRLLRKQESGVTLTPEDQSKLTNVMQVLSPILALYIALGPEFHTLRQGEGFRHFLSEASRFGQMEEAAVAQSGQAQRYVPLIPRQFYTAGSPVMTMRLRTETTEISIAQQTKQPRFNLALEAMVALSLAEQGSADYEAAYMAMVQAQLAEAGISYPPGGIGASQLRSAQNWTTRTYQQVGHGDGGAVAQITGQAAGVGKKSPLNPLSGIKNPVVRQALIKAAIVAAPTLTAGFVIYQAVKPLIDAVTGVANFFGVGGGTASTVASTAGTVGSSVASAVGSGVADGASNVAINAKSIAGEQLSKAATVANTSGTMVKTAMTAITTTAAVAPAVVAAGILGPMLGMLILTMIVWSVIGNSLNDYGGLGVARRGLGVEGCWPTTGTITQLDTPAHKTDKTRGGTALDIGAGELTEIYTPFAGRAKAFAENPSPDPMDNNGGYGNYVRVYTNLGFDLIFAHMKAIELPDGEQLVVAGQMIGGVGTTGNSGGNHLHYEMWDIKGLGMRITDVTPVPASEITIGLAVSAYECGTPATSPSPSPSPSSIDPSQLGDLTQPFPTTPPENL